MCVTCIGFIVLHMTSTHSSSLHSIIEYPEMITKLENTNPCVTDMCLTMSICHHWMIISNLKTWVMVQ